MNVPGISVAAIVEATSEVFGVSAQDIRSHRRTPGVVAARFCAVGLSCEYTSKTLAQIGFAIGDRDHTTIIYARDRFPQLLAIDADYARLVGFVREGIETLIRREKLARLRDIDATAVARRILDNPVRGPFAASILETRALAAALLQLQRQLQLQHETNANV